MHLMLREFLLVFVYVNTAEADTAMMVLETIFQPYCRLQPDYKLKIQALEDDTFFFRGFNDVIGQEREFRVENATYRGPGPKFWFAGEVESGEGDMEIVYNLHHTCTRKRQWASMRVDRPRMHRVSWSEGTTTFDQGIWVINEFVIIQHEDKEVIGRPLTGLMV